MNFHQIYFSFCLDQITSYVYCPKGLFPMPLSRCAKVGLVTRVRSKFKLLGKFLAKALMDSRMVYINVYYLLYPHCVLYVF